MGNRFHISTLRIDIKELTSYSGWHQDAVIFYYFLMSKYKKSIIYNYTSVDLAKKTGFDRNTISKYIKFLIQHGFIKKEGAHLVLIKRNEYIKISVYKTLSWSKFKNLIYLKALKVNMQQQEYVVRMKNIFQKEKAGWIKPTEYRKFMKFYKRHKKSLEGKLNNSIIYSNRSIAKLLNVSIGKANQLINYWKNNKIIHYKENLQLIKENSSYNEFQLLLKNFNNHSLNSFPVYSNNNLYLHCGSSIDIINSYHGEALSLFKISTSNKI